MFADSLCELSLSFNRALLIETGDITVVPM